MRSSAGCPPITLGGHKAPVVRGASHKGRILAALVAPASYPQHIVLSWLCGHIAEPKPVRAAQRRTVSVFELYVVSFTLGTLDFLMSFFYAVEILEIY